LAEAFVDLKLGRVADGAVGQVVVAAELQPDVVGCHDHVVVLKQQNKQLKVEWGLFLLLFVREY